VMTVENFYSRYGAEARKDAIRSFASLRQTASVFT